MSLAADFAAALDPAVLFKRAFGLTPLPWQVDYLRETRPTVLLKGRQVGASLSAAALAIKTAVYWPDINVVIVSPSLKQSTEICRRARVGLRQLSISLSQDSTSTLRLANGSRILSLPGTARSVRGWTAALLIIDEAAFVEHETFVAARAHCPQTAFPPSEGGPLKGGCPQGRPAPSREDAPRTERGRQAPRLKHSPPPYGPGQREGTPTRGPSVTERPLGSPPNGEVLGVRPL